MLRLTIRHGDRLQHVDAPAGPVGLGSHGSNEIHVPLPGVSRRHAVVEPFPGGVRFRDVGSKNGLIQHGERLATVVLRPGDSVCIGRAEVWLQEIDSADAGVSVALARKRRVASSKVATTAPVGPSSFEGAPAGLLQLVREFGSSRAPEARALGHLLDRAAEILTARHLFFVDRVEPSARTGRVLGMPVPAGLIETAVSLAKGMADRTTLSQELSGGVLLTLRSGPRPCGPLAAAIVGERAAEKLAPWQEEFLDFILVTLAGSSMPAADPAIASPNEPLLYPKRFVRGSSLAMSRLLASLRAAVASDLDVLLLGETGTGKEFLAEIVHASGPTAGGPFVPINCAAIPSELLEAELFGVKARVATGVDARQGLLARAQGGCVFLDEIGDMPPPLQAKLLRALQEREVWPVGGHQAEQIQVRVISSTNRDLPAMVRRGLFRADLYYRLRGLELEVPPLRDRREDIPELAGFFAARAADAYKKDVAGISSMALDQLLAHDWPGNVRELKSTLERAVLLCPNGGVLGTAEFESSLRPLSGASVGPGEAESSPNAMPPVDHPKRMGGPPSDLASQVDKVERTAILDALAHSDGNRSKAARQLGITRNGLALKMRRLGIRMP